MRVFTGVRSKEAERRSSEQVAWKPEQIKFVCQPIKRGRLADQFQGNKAQAYPNALSSKARLLIALGSTGADNPKGQAQPWSWEEARYVCEEVLQDM